MVQSYDYKVTTITFSDKEIDNVIKHIQDYDTRTYQEVKGNIPDFVLNNIVEEVKESNGPGYDHHAIDAAVESSSWFGQELRRTAIEDGILVDNPRECTITVQTREITTPGVHFDWDWSEAFGTHDEIYFNWAREDSTSDLYQDTCNAVMHSRLSGDDTRDWEYIPCMTLPTWKKFMAVHGEEVKRKEIEYPSDFSFYFPVSPCPPPSEADLLREETAWMRSDMKIMQKRINDLEKINCILKKRIDSFKTQAVKILSENADRNQALISMKRRARQATRASARDAKYAVGHAGEETTQPPTAITPSFVEKYLLPKTCGNVSEATSKLSSAIDGFASTAFEGMKSASAIAIIMYLYRACRYVTRGKWSKLAVETGFILAAAPVLGFNTALVLADLKDLVSEIHRSVEGCFKSSPVAHGGESFEKLEEMFGGVKGSLLEGLKTAVNSMSGATLKCAVMVLGALLGLIHGKLPTPSVLIRSFSDFGRASLGFTKLETTMEWFTNFVGDQMELASSGKTMEQVATEKLYPKLASVLASIKVLESAHFQPHVLKRSSEACNLILQVAADADEIEGVAIENSNIKLINLMRTKKILLAKMRKDAQLALSAIPEEREEPYTVYLYGVSGQGKSGLQRLLRGFLYREYIKSDPKKALEYTRRTCFHARKVNNDFWEGYRGQPIVEYDDIFQAKDTLAKPNMEIQEVISAVNLAPFPLHMAVMEMKANTFFVSDFIVATSNVQTPQPVSITQPSALHRRFHMTVQVNAKDEFLKTLKGRKGSSDYESVVDPDKVRAYQDKVGKPHRSFEPDVYEVLEYNMSTGAPVGTAIDLSAFLLRVKDRIDAKRRFNADFEKDILEFLDLKEEDEAEPEIVGELRAAAEIWQDATEAVAHGGPEELRKAPKPCAFDGQTCAYGDRCVAERFVSTEDLKETDEFGVPTGNHTMCSLYHAEFESCSAKFDKYFGYVKECAEAVRGKFSDAWHAMKEIFVKNRLLVGIAITALTTTLGLSSLYFRLLRSDCPLKNSTSVDELEGFYGCEEMQRDNCDYCRILDVTKWVETEGGLRSRHQPGTYSHARGLTQVCLDNYFIFDEEDITRLTKLNKEAHKREITNAGYFAARQVWWVEDSLLYGVAKGLITNEEMEKAMRTIETHRLILSNSATAHSRNEGSKPPAKNVIAHSNVTRTKAAAKPAVAHGPPYKFLERSDDTVAKEQVRRVQGNNQVQLCFQKSRDGKTYYTYGAGTFVQGKVLMCTYHQTLDVESIHVRGASGLEWSKYEMKDLKITRLETLDRPTDICLITFVREATRPSIVKYFIDKQNAAVLNRVDCILFGVRHLNDDDRPTYFSDCTSMCKLEGQTVEYKDSRQETFVLPTSFGYNLVTKPGDCGALLAVRSNTTNNKLAGMHVCGTSTTGYSNIITKELLMHGLEKHNAKQRHSVDGACPVAHNGVEFFRTMEPMDIPRLGDAVVLGEVQEPRRAVKTELKPSLIHGEVTASITKPAHLSTFTLNGEQVDPMEKGFKKVLSVQKPMKVSESSIKRAVQDVKNVHSVIPDGAITRLLTLEESVWGNEEAGINELNRKTSPGYPYVLWNKEPGKKTWLGSGDDKFISAELQRDVEELESHIKEGRRGNAAYVATLKDERRPIEKVDAGKTRVFAAAPMNLSILVRKYFGAFVGALTLNKIDNEVGVGTNVYSPDWNKTGEYLRSKGNKVIAGDFSNFDGSLRQDLLWEVFDVMNDWYADEHTTERTVLFDMICNADIVYKGMLVRLTHSQPSGNPLTVIINSIFNQIVMRIAYYELVEERGGFRSQVSLQCYGDDNVLNISDEVIDQYNQLTITEVLKNIGLTYTDEGKTGEMVKYRTLSDVRYLKRNFHLTPAGLYEGQLPMEVVLDMTNWVRGTDVHAATRENLESAYSELCLFSEKEYRAVSHRIQRAASFAGVYTQVPEYHEHRRKVADLICW
jgi:hypothetical protein